MLIVCEPGLEDIVSNLIFESGFSGAEEKVVDDSTVFTAYFVPAGGDLDPVKRFASAIKGVETGNDHPAAVISETEPVPDEDWEKSWREGLELVEIGERLVVHPSWIPYDNDGEHVEIVIDPKMAFGTGSHDTTRMCLTYLEHTTLRDKSVLDVGCGSGILSIAAVKLGARCAIGFDIDKFSITNAAENIRSNSVHDRVQLYQANLSEAHPGHFNIILANLISSTLIPHLRKFQSFLLPDAVIVFSGILAEELTDFSAHLKKAKFKIVSTETLGEWVSIICE